MTLNYKTLGSGKPLVILHGLLGSLDNWVTVSKYLSKSYKVYIIDLPNHGKSYHSQVFSYEDMSNDIDSFFNKNGCYSGDGSNPDSCFAGCVARNSSHLILIVFRS